ncbi:hypothetical protein ACFO4O_04360 [Glaciecola siphonariae]|uniref:Bacteriophage tail tape measure N-terminal domain-containing protein n=1 Tax=Glaciecola siphonariae TaxID=521012 RepID=A0ABV9LU67_9ALTE
MSKTQIAELVTKMTVDNAQFERQMRKSQTTTGALAKTQKRAANESVFGSNRMSQGFRQAANSAATLSGPMGGIASRLGTVATGFSTVGIAATGVGLAISGLAVIVGLAAAKFAELEKRTLRTEALFKATSGSAGLTTKELSGLATTVAENTLASVAGTTQAINVLQTFKSVSGDAFTRTITLSQDLAAVMGSDIKSSALQLGKALEDPITGLNSLRRSGVSFSAAQKEVIRNLVETGRVAEAQKIILDTLEKQVGGAGAAEGAGLSGAADLLGQRWDEMLESFAETTSIGQATTSSLNAIAGALESVTGFISGPQSLEEYREKLVELRAEQAKFGNSGRGVAASVSRQAEIEEIERTIQKLEEKQQKEASLIEEGKRLRKEAEEEAAEQRLRQAQKQGAAELGALEKSLSSQRELYLIQWEERNAQIEALVLSQEEIESQGYENLLELQRGYLAENNKLYAQSVFEFDERKRKEVEIVQAAEKAKAKAERDKIQREREMTGNQFVQNLADLAQYNSRYAGMAKAAAIAQATIKTYESATGAFNSLANIPIVGPVLGAAAAAAAIAAGLANVAAIKAQPVAGARELGGPVAGGKTYLVGEKGPELFQPGAAGQITSNTNLQRAGLGGGSSQTIQVNLTAMGGGDQRYWNQQARYITKALAREERR